jgi:hypothetical protein
MTRPARLVDVILSEITDDDLARLAALLAPHLPAPATTTVDGWLDSWLSGKSVAITSRRIRHLSLRA